ncbi:MAG: hypothetical protein E6I45_10165 [Chloroflexi bacterium]|nr:MAG: hypothetical protein E6I45_10165 [Chloroflexota bacterium]
MIRHTVLFVWADKVTQEQKARVKDGMSYCYYGSNVLALDFGEDLGLVPTKFGLALLHDHRDRAAWDEYNENTAHHRVGEYIKGVTVPDLAARVDWVYEGPASRRGGVRHTSLYRWAPGTDEAGKQAARSALISLRTECPTVRALEIGDDLGWYPPNYDWIVEAHFDDVDGLRAFIEHPAQRRAADAVGAVTAENGTAQNQHRMLAG